MKTVRLKQECIKPGMASAVPSVGKFRAKALPKLSKPQIVCSVSKLSPSMPSFRPKTRLQPTCTHRPSAVSYQRRARRMVPSLITAAVRRGNTLIVCATLAGVEGTTSVETLLSEELAVHPLLVRGKLDNGFQYVILPNKAPPKRFEAHLEVHAGSVDELEHEQGVAHLVEHVTFLGSKRREMLLGTGARANAYTDFHHTVFHVHSPIVNGTTGKPMLPQVLEALEEIAFEPQFLSSRIEKERKAVLAEAQMMNTIEYRVDCQLLAYLHEENSLGRRFPIGQTEQVKQWGHDVLINFWQKWYFPANATLYLVGDMEMDVQEMEALIRKTFGKVPAGRLPPPAPAPDSAPPAPANGAAPAPAAAAAGAHAAANGAAANGIVATNGNGKVSEALLGELKQRHNVRPPVVHKHGAGPLAPGEQPAKISIFRHPLLQQFMLTLFCKLPVRSMGTMGDLQRAFMIRLIMSTFQFRINTRYVEANPPFAGIELDVSDSGREGCVVCTLTIMSEPYDWEGAVMVAVQEARRLQRHGLTYGELQRYRLATLRDSAQLAEQGNSIPSIETLDFVMESLALEHTIMEHRMAHQAMVKIADSITLEDVNALCRSMLTFASDYGREAEMLAEAKANPELYSDPGPTRATSVIACIPALVDASGASMAPGAPTGRGNSLGAAGHIDADAIDLAELEKQSQDEMQLEVPEDAQEFVVDASEIARALSSQTLEVSATDDVEVPENLVPRERLAALLAEQKPHFVPLKPLEGGGDALVGPDGLALPDPDTGVCLRRLSNGLKVNYRHTDNEPKAGLLRLVASGGRAAEPKDKIGVVSVGVRALSENGRVGDWQREQVEAFCISNLINCILEVDVEYIVMDLRFVVGGHGGLQAVFELMHEFLRQPPWEQASFERAKSVFLGQYRSTAKSLERSTSDRLVGAMLGEDRRFRDPTPDDLEALTLDSMKAAVMAQLHPANIEVSAVGDFDAKELEQLCLQYLGTLPARVNPAPIVDAPIVFQNPGPELRRQNWHLRDSDERACGIIAGPMPARWGRFGSSEALPPRDQVPEPVPPPVLAASAPAAEIQSATRTRRDHPLYSMVTIMLLTEVINSRLFTTVRDTLGLTYDVSFEATTFERLRGGWFTVTVTSYPHMIHDAVRASLRVLRELKHSPITARELMRAKRTVLTRHESDLKDNSYWLALLTHLQAEDVPLKSAACLRDLRTCYEAATVEDLYDVLAHLDLGDEKIFTCIGTSGKSAPAVNEAPTDLNAAMEYDGSAAVAQDPIAMFTAMLAAAQGMGNLANAFKTFKAKEGEGPVNGLEGPAPEQQQQQQRQQ